MGVHKVMAVQEGSIASHITTKGSVRAILIFYKWSDKPTKQYQVISKYIN